MRRNREQHRHRINCDYSPIIGVTAIAVALTLNIRNNVWGYWINLCVLVIVGARAALLKLVLSVLVQQLIVERFYQVGE